MNADKRLGTTVGSYRIESKIAGGGMAEVYLVRHIELGAVAALKVMSPGATDEAKHRFRQEGRVAAAIGSHRVVQPFDYGVLSDGSPYLLMDYVKGRSLAEELADSGAMGWQRAAKIALRTADTLRLAHEQSIVHRDIKPANILLAWDGARDFAVRLIDWGVARARGTAHLVETRQTMQVGTPGYMSPEALLAIGQDHRTDVFSLGVVLYEMLTGRRPFTVALDLPSTKKFLSEEPRPINELRSPSLEPVPKILETLVLRSLAKEPAERIDMTTFQRALGEVFYSHREQPQSSGRVERPMLTMMSAAPPDLQSCAQANTDSTIDGKVSSWKEPLHMSPIDLRPPPSSSKAPARRRTASLIGIVVLACLAVANVNGSSFVVSSALPGNSPPNVVTKVDVRSVAPSIPTDHGPGVFDRSVPIAFTAAASSKRAMRRRVTIATRTSEGADGGNDYIVNPFASK